MLLSHAGEKDYKSCEILGFFLANSPSSWICYTFFNEKIRRSGLPKGYDEFSGLMHDIELPLLFEPGTSWEYGVSYFLISLAISSLGFCFADSLC
jgi:hypothetical protein